MKKNFLIITIVIFTLFGCFDNQDKQFKNIAKSLRTLLLELQNVEVVEDFRKSNGGDVIMLKFDKGIAFIEKRNGDFKRIADSLEGFSTKNINSKWSDDADFLRVIEYISISLPGNNMHLETVKSIKYFLDKYPAFTIEEWTKKYFSDITLFHLFDKNETAFNFSPYIELSKLPEVERIRAYRGSTSIGLDLDRPR